MLKLRLFYIHTFKHLYYIPIVEYILNMKKYPSNRKSLLNLFFQRVVSQLHMKNIKNYNYILSMKVAAHPNFPFSKFKKKAVKPARISDFFQGGWRYFHP